MVSIILATVLFGGIALVGARFLFRRVRRFLQWRRDTLMRPWKQLLLILPPLVFFGRTAAKISGMMQTDITGSWGQPPLLQVFST